MGVSGVPENWKRLFHRPSLGQIPLPRAINLATVTVIPREVRAPRMTDESEEERITFFLTVPDSFAKMGGWGSC